MSKKNNKRIVVTGMGCVSCFGTDVGLFYDSLLAGKSGITTITGFDPTELSTRFAGEIKEFDAGDYLEKKTARRVDKFIAYAVVAGKKALADAGIEGEQLEKLNKSRAGVIIGSGIGGMSIFTTNVITSQERGVTRINPFFIPYTLTNMAGAMLAMDVGFMGPNYSVSTACATGNYAISFAAGHIRNGDTDIMVCGGSEAPINTVGVGGFCACKALSQRNDNPQAACRPWDKGRDGFVMGEGAGVLVLESLEHALARGAPIYCEYLGSGLSCDAHHITEPSPDGSGVALSIRNAIADAGIDLLDINYVNAHATSTPVGDMAEINAMKQVFSKRDHIVINGTKSLIGHSLGAAGGFEAIATVMACKTGKIHPTLNHDDPEEGIDFHVATEQMDLAIQAAMSNSFGFGGHNASVIFKPYKG